MPDEQAPLPPDSPYALDRTPLPTDWEDLRELFADMRKFAQENEGFTFLGADDPGCNHQPPRIPRMGWAAFKDVNGEEVIRQWTIPLYRLVTYVRNQNTPEDVAFAESLKTAAGRKALLDAELAK